MPSVPEQLRMLERVEQALVEHDHVRLGRDLPDGAVEFGRRIGRGLGSTRHAQKYELGAGAAITIDDSSVPIAQIGGLAALVGRKIGKTIL